MEINVGIDSVEIKRIEKSVSVARFVRRVYGEDEQSELERRAFPPQSAAACFAAKEALLKAAGRGIGAVPLNEIQLLHMTSGQPYIRLSENARGKLSLDGYRIRVSVTHTRDTATVIVIICSPD